MDKRIVALLIFLPWVAISLVLLDWITSLPKFNLFLFLGAVFLCGVPAGKLLITLVTGLDFEGVVVKWSALSNLHKIVIFVFAVPFLLGVPIAIGFAVH